MGLRIIDQFFRSPEIFNAKPIIAYDDDGNEKPGVELYFRLPLINVKTGEILAEDVFITGMIDVIESNRGKPKIKDHKTASREYSDWFIDTSLQLTMYSYAFRYLAAEGKLKTKAKKEQCVGFNIFMKPKDKNEPIYVERQITDSDLENLYKTVKRVHKGVQNEVFIPALNDACEAYGGCEYRDVCRDYQQNKGVFEDGFFHPEKLKEYYGSSVEVRS